VPRDKSKLEKSLLKKGFQRIEGDHHFFIYYTLSGQKSLIKTKTSHTPKMKEIGDSLLTQMAKQCKLSKQEFLNLVDCPLNQQAYEELLKEKEEL